MWPRPGPAAGSRSRQAWATCSGCAASSEGAGRQAPRLGIPPLPVTADRAAPSAVRSEVQAGERSRTTLDVAGVPHGRAQSPEAVDRLAIAGERHFRRHRPATAGVRVALAAYLRVGGEEPV